MVTGIWRWISPPPVVGWRRSPCSSPTSRTAPAIRSSTASSNRPWASGIEGASFITAYPRRDALRVAAHHPARRHAGRADGPADRAAGRRVDRAGRRCRRRRTATIASPRARCAAEASRRKSCTRSASRQPTRTRAPGGRRAGWRSARGAGRLRRHSEQPDRRRDVHGCQPRGGARVRQRAGTAVVGEDRRSDRGVSQGAFARPGDGARVFRAGRAVREPGRTADAETNYQAGARAPRSDDRSREVPHARQLLPVRAQAGPGGRRSSPRWSRPTPPTRAA